MLEVRRDVTTDTPRNQEIETKLQRLRELMAAHDLEAVRLRGVDWFSWATAGGNSVVIFTNEAGVAEVLVTPNRAWVLTDRIEASRLKDEEIPPGLEIKEFPWADKGQIETLVQSRAPRGRLASDRPLRKELSLPRAIRELKLPLLPSEIERYRVLGRESAQAMREALGAAEPGWTEQRLAGEGAKACWARGIHPTLVLVAGESRLARYRHPFPSGEKIGNKVMMVFCARRHGLYANLTRFVYFRAPTSAERSMHDHVAQIESAALSGSRAGARIGQVFGDLARAYSQAGFADEILNHHQGGPTGYLSREVVAQPQALRADSEVIQTGTALAWNPSLPGVKIEDTVCVTGQGQLEILTHNPDWPSKEVAGRKRPDVWVRG